MNWLLDPLQFPFMQQALAMALCIGIACALLSCLVVLKGWALMGDAVAHGILPGVVLAAYFSLPLWFGAFLAGIACALCSTFLQRHSNLRADTILGIVFSSLFALGILLFLHFDSGQHLTHILFGSLLGIDAQTRWRVIGITVLVILVMVLKGRDLMLFVFDEVQARMVGLPVGLLYIALLSLLSVTVVAALPAVGVVLVAALLITPGISAQLVVSRFTPMLCVACLLSILACTGGVLLAFHWDASVSACIVLLQAALFMAMLAVRAGKNLLRTSA